MLGVGVPSLPRVVPPQGRESGAEHFTHDTPPQAAANTDGQGAAESSERVCVTIARVASAADTGHMHQHNA